MSRINTPQKTRGRPRVDSEEVKVRIQRHQLDKIDNWRDQQSDNPGRPEAIRRLVEQALNQE